VAGFRAGRVAVSPGLGSIMGTGGTSGSKPIGRTRSRVELFIFPEQLPGPARFGKGSNRMASRDELPTLMRYRFEVDDDLVALALQYANSPVLLITDLRRILWDEFNQVFRMRRRKVTWRFWELFYVINRQWDIVDGPSPYGGFCLTEEQLKYSLKLERLIIATSLVASRLPEVFRDFDLERLWEICEACSSIRHGMRVGYGPPNPSEIGPMISVLETRIQFLAAFRGEGVESTGGILLKSSEDPPETIALSAPPAVSVNAQMLDIMQSVGNEVCLGWSVEDWREKLDERFGRKPSKSTIHKQPTWDLIRTLRAQAGAEAHEHQTAKDETGRRRSRIT
jgi:hypothetical protein